MAYVAHTESKKMDTSTWFAILNVDTGFIIMRYLEIEDQQNLAEVDQLFADILRDYGGTNILPLCMDTYTMAFNEKLAKFMNDNSAQITKLIVHGGLKLPNFDWSIFKGLTHLTDVFLYNLSLKTADIYAMAMTLKSLKSLQLENSNYIQTNFSTKTKFEAQCLKVLKLNMDKDFVNLLENLPNLEELTLTGINSDTLEDLQKCSFINNLADQITQLEQIEKDKLIVWNNPLKLVAMKNHPTYLERENINFRMSSGYNGYDSSYVDLNLSQNDLKLETLKLFKVLSIGKLHFHVFVNLKRLKLKKCIISSNELFIILKKVNLHTLVMKLTEIAFESNDCNTNVYGNSLKELKFDDSCNFKRFMQQYPFGFANVKNVCFRSECVREMIIVLKSFSSLKYLTVSGYDFTKIQEDLLHFKYLKYVKITSYKAIESQIVESLSKYIDKVIINLEYTYEESGCHDLDFNEDDGY